MVQAFLSYIKESQKKGLCAVLEALIEFVITEGRYDPSGKLKFQGTVRPT